MIFLAWVFFMLLKEGRILYKICNFLIGMLEKLHIVKHGDKLRKKLEHKMCEYQENAYRNIFLECYAEVIAAFSIFYDIYGNG